MKYLACVECEGNVQADIATRGNCILDLIVLFLTNQYIEATLMSMSVFAYRIDSFLNQLEVDKFEMQNCA